jgi:hypothetical protein
VYHSLEPKSECFRPSFLTPPDDCLVDVLSELKETALVILEMEMMMLTTMMTATTPKKELALCYGHRRQLKPGPHGPRRRTWRPTGFLGE